MKPGDLNEDARRLIDAGRSGREPSELVRARVRRAVATKLARGVIAVSLAHSSSLLAAGTKLGVILAVATGVGAGVWYGAKEDSADDKPPATLGVGPMKNAAAPSPARQPPAVSTAREELAEVASVAQPAPAEPPQALMVPNATSKAAPRDRAAEATTSSNLTREVALLAEASAMLNQGDAASAQRLLHSYDREFKNKVLVQERAATGVLVHCGLGNVQAARRASQRFQRAWPKSPLMARIAASCAGDSVKR